MSSLRSLALITAALALSACNRDNRTTADSAAGSVTSDASDIGHPTSVTPAAGGAAQVTSTDAKSVRLASEYKLTYWEDRRDTVNVRSWGKHRLEGR